MNDKLKGSLLVVGAAMIWGMVGTAVRFAGSVDAWTIAFYRCLFGALTVLVIIIVSRKLGEIVPKKKIGYLFVLGLVNAMVIAFLALSIKTSTLANAYLLFYTAPVIATLMARIFLKERIGKVSVISLILCMIGIASIMGNGFEASMWIGTVFGMLAGVSYASSMTVGRYVKEYSGLISTFWTNTISVVILLLISNPLTVTTVSLPLLAVMGIAFSGIAVFLLYEGLRSIRTQNAGIILMLDPLTNIIMGAIIFSEIPGVVTTVGGAQILSAILLQIFAKKN